MIRKSSNHWKFWLVLFSIIKTCAFAQPQPGGMSGFFQAWYGVTAGDPYEQLLPTAYWYPSVDLNNTDRILGIASTNTVNVPSTTANGWEFNGTSHRLDMGRPTSLEPNTNAQYSMAAWVQRRGTLSGQFGVGGIMGKSFLAGGDRWSLHGENATFNSLLDEAGGAVGVSDGASNATGVWYHVAMTVDRSSANQFFLYRDGIRVATGSFTDTDPITFAGNINVPFRFGSYNDGAGNPGNYFNGWIDRAAVWNGRSLTSNQVFNLFEQTKAGKK